MALIPTLTLIDVEGKKGGKPAAEIEQWINMVAHQVNAYSDGGVQILFGTDVGYIDQFDTSQEFALMARAGMSFRQILASLTTAPVERFVSSQRSGALRKRWRVIWWCWARILRTT
jgi:imidazolonepropionase-like amidohydrolase